MIDRRSFLLSTAAAGSAQAQGRRLRAAVIGHTGHGEYGHGIDSVWKAFDHIDIVATADPDDAGRLRAQQRLGAPKAYADYAEMLERERPDCVSVCPRWMDQRAAMVTAAADAGCHIYCEKAFARNLEEADAMVGAVERNGVKLQLAHQMRRSPFTLRVKAMLEAGEIGDIQEIRGRGKEDRRAGGEDLMVLGSHICDVMRTMLGDPRWVFSHVTEDGEELKRKHVRRPTEPIGPIAGRETAAMFAFDGGVHGYFGSKASDETHPLRFGTTIYGSKGVIFLPNAIYPRGAQAYVLRTPSWVPDAAHRWEPIMASRRRLAVSGAK